MPLFTQRQQMPPSYSLLISATHEDDLKNERTFCVSPLPLPLFFLAAGTKRRKKEERGAGEYGQKVSPPKTDDVKGVVGGTVVEQRRGKAITLVLEKGASCWELHLLRSPSSVLRTRN